MLLPDPDFAAIFDSWMLPTEAERRWICVARRLQALPVYEYKCSSEHLYDKTEGYHAPTEHPCPHCGEPAKRQLSLPAVIFKGSGFYSTDNPKTSHGGSEASAADTSDKAGAPSSDDTSNAKTEASHGGNGASAADTTNKADAPSSDDTSNAKPEAKTKD